MPRIVAHLLFFCVINNVQETTGKAVFGQLPEHDAAEAFVQGIEGFEANGGAVVIGGQETFPGVIRPGGLGDGVPVVGPAAVGGKPGGLVTVGDAAEEVAGAIEAAVDAVDVIEHPGVEGQADDDLMEWDADGVEVLDGMVG